MAAYSVSSELYNEKNYETNKKPCLKTNNVVSVFIFKIPSIADSDGNLINEHETCKIELELSKQSDLKLVGLQLWRGALLLADWLIYNSNNLKNSKILELGSGVGLTSIIAAMFAPVICTDINKGGILELIKSNVKRNSSIIKHPISVKELDFMSPLSEAIKQDLPEVKIVLAADVIYYDDITSAFIDTLYNILSASKEISVYIAVERRYIENFNSAPCYDYFLNGLQILERKNIKTEQININFPQYFDYERNKNLVLWKLHR